MKVISIGSESMPQVHLFTYIKHKNEKIMVKINDQLNGTEELVDTNSSIESLIDLEQRKLKNNGEFINIHVTLVSSPQSFVIRLQEDVYELNCMLTSFQNYCQSNKAVTSLSDLKKGECYAVFDEDNQMWIR